MSLRGVQLIVAKCRELFERSGKSEQEIGRATGYAHPVTARDVVRDFLRDPDPRLSTLCRFAEAVEIDICRLIADACSDDPYASMHGEDV